MADRKSELEQKRQKLASLRETRNEQKASKTLLNNDASSASLKGDKNEADQILQQLGISDLPHSSSGLELRVPNSMQSSAISGVDSFLTPSTSLVMPPNEAQVTK